MKFTIAFLLIIVHLQSFAYASNSTPTAYKVTVKKVEASTDEGTTYVTLGEGNKEIDIASVGAGQAAADYISGVGIAAGFYNALRVTVSNTFKITGVGTNTTGNARVCTQASGTPEQDSGCTAAEQSMTVTTDPGVAGMTLDTTAGTITIEDKSIAIVMEEGKKTTIRVSFDVNNALGLSDGACCTAASMFPNAPSQTVTST